MLLVPKEAYNSSGCCKLETVASQEITVGRCRKCEWDLNRSVAFKQFGLSEMVKFLGLCCNMVHYRNHDLSMGLPFRSGVN